MPSFICSPRSVERGEQIKEGIRRIARGKVARSVQLLPRPKLSAEKQKAECAGGHQAGSYAVELPPLGGSARSFHADTPQHEKDCVQPKYLRNGEGAPVLAQPAHEVRADREREQRRGDSEEH